MTGVDNVTTSARASVSATGGLLGFERELVCSICTEILYTPLTILNCLHTFCGSCLKEWFYHQHRKASSRSSSSVGNPYSCPTCRSEVRDVQHNATVSNLLELFLAANPARDRSQQDKDDMDKIYKPDGTRPADKILPKVERRRERRHRREENDAALRERQMIEEARQRSLRDFDQATSTSRLAPPRSERSSRSASRERDERRQRRHERERQREQTPVTPPTHSSHTQQEEADWLDAIPPVSSPRHPGAVEARQRERRMSHQASLRSLVSASESGTGTGDSLEEARIMQEILDAGLLGEIDVGALTEAEQDILAERIAELYRQTHPRSDRSSGSRQHSRPPSPPSDSTNQSPTRQIRIQSESRRRSNSRSRNPTNPPSNREAGARDRSHSSRPPAAPVTNIGRSNSSSSVTIHHRRRTSDQSRQSRRAGGSRQSSRERGPASRSATNLVEGRPDIQPSQGSGLSMTRTRTSTEPVSPPRASDVWLQAGGEDRRLQSRKTPSPSRSPRYTQTMPVTHHSTDIDNSRHQGRPTVAELDSTTASVNASPIPQYNEPSVRCFRCEKVDIQYEIFKHCQPCDVDLCMRCYREGKGCKHWYGFGHAAEDNFEALRTRERTTEPPHLLISRQYRKPTESGILNTRTSPQTQEVLASVTKSNPRDRLQEGRFCDRCGSFANSQFWLCDICNDGEWGFCRQCVQEHHCCTHPLLPVAYVPESQISPQSLANHLAGLNMSNPPAASLLSPQPLSLSAVPAISSRPLTPTSTTSSTGLPRPHPGYGYDYLSINVNCDMCHNIIFPSSPRYHCPFHASDYDICTSCYASFLVQSRMRRDADNSAEVVAGWRKCPAGHRMTILAFEADEEDGAMRRVVKHDLVGGWKMNDKDMKAWNTEHNQHSLSPPTSPPLASRGTWTWKENADGMWKTRSRTSTLTHSVNALSGGGGGSGITFGPHKQRFPPDGGFGARGVAYYSYWPDDGDAGAGELALPRGADVSEMEDINGDWWSGVYAGDIGFFPAGYVRE